MKKKTKLLRRDRCKYAQVSTPPLVQRHGKSVQTDEMCAEVPDWHKRSHLKGRWIIGEILTFTRGRRCEMWTDPQYLTQIRWEVLEMWKTDITSFTVTWCLIPTWGKQTQANTITEVFCFKPIIIMMLLSNFISWNACLWHQSLFSTSWERRKLKSIKVFMKLTFSL